MHSYIYIYICVCVCVWVCVCACVCGCVCVAAFQLGKSRRGRSLLNVQNLLLKRNESYLSRQCVKLKKNILTANPSPTLLAIHFLQFSR